MKARTRVLVVDDSAIARELIERGLSLDPEIEVVGKASDVLSARDKIVFLEPDVITLDVEMPGMDGIEFLRRLMPQYPKAVIVVSAVTQEGSRRALEALEAGAVDVVAKPSTQDGQGLKRMLLELAERIKEAAKADVSKLRPRAAAQPSRRRSTSRPPKRNQIVALGASTGGTTALRSIFQALPKDMPPILIVQHMPPVFTKMFAESLNKESGLEVREAVDGDVLRDGLALVAPGDFHMRLVKESAVLMVRCDKAPKTCGHRPSVDILFGSVAQVAGARAVAMLLTGMGRDGAEGLLAIRRKGGRCLAQDEASSVVFGMPREAWENGGAEMLVPLDRAADEILARLSESPAKEGQT